MILNLEVGLSDLFTTIKKTLKNCTKISFNHGIFLIPVFFMFSLNVFSFVKNEGQFKNQEGENVQNLLFQFRGEDIVVNLNRDGFSYEIREFGSDSKKNPKETETRQIEFNRCDIYFQNCNKNFEVVTDKGVISGNLYKGIDKRYILREFKKVLYKNLYENIDIEFLLTESGFKYNFILYPGAKIEDIQLLYDSPFEINSSAESIIVRAPLGEIHETIPLSYVLKEGGKTELKVSYQSLNRNLFGFTTDYLINDKDTLIIDPVPNRNFGTYIGGTMEDFANAMCTDETKSTYIAGQTRSSNAIATTGVHQGTLDTFFDAYIVKYSSSGAKIWGTYFGGDGYDRGLGIEYQDGNIFLSGNTLSNNMATVGAHQENTVDGDEAFLARFDSTGQLIWSTYYGGELHDFADDICFDSQGNVYITGHTSSTYNIATTGAHMEVFTGTSAAFLAKFDTAGNLIWGTYYGDSFDEGIGIGSDSNDKIYITGLTYSTAGIATTGVHQVANGGGVDAFLAKFDANGVLEWGTYYGGMQNDISNAIIVTDSNRIYITGDTRSANGIHFNQGFQSSPGNINEGFIAKFTDQGNILWGSYVGGEDDDFIYGIDHFSNEDVLITGVTRSTTNISTPNAYQGDFSGFYDALVMRITSDGQKGWGTYYGGVDFDEAKDILIDQNQSTFTITGNTTSTDSISTVNSHQEVSGGDDEAFLVQFCDPNIPHLNYSGLNELCYSNDIYISTDSSLFDSYLWSDGSSNFDLDLTGVAPGNYQFFVETTDTNGCAAKSDTINIAVHLFTPIAFTTNQNLYCEGDTLIIKVNNDFDIYSWSTGDSGDSILITDLQPGQYTYYIDAVNTAGCTYSDTISIEFFPTPSPALNVNGSANFCNNETVEIDLNQSYTSYEWFNGANTPSIVLSSEELVWVEVMNSFGCKGISDSIFVDSDVFTPVISMMNAGNPICEGDTVTLELNNSYDTYLWSNGETDSVIILDTQLLGYGSHFYYVEVSNNCGGQAISDSIKIEVVQVVSPTVSIDYSNPVCLGDTVNLWVDSSYVQYLWNNTYSDSAISVSTAGLGAGDFYYSVEITHECGAVLKSDSVKLEIVDPVTPVISMANASNPICEGDLVTLELNSSFNSYLWSNGQTDSVIVLNTQSLGSGSHFYYVEVVNSCGALEVSDSVEIEVVQVSVPVIITDYSNPVCLGDTVNLWVDSIYESYLWNNIHTGPGVSVISSGIGSGDFYYSVEVTHECGAVLTSDSVLLEIVEPINPDIVRLDSGEVICVGQEVSFQIDQNFSFIEWSNNDMVSVVSESQASPGSFSIFVHTVDYNGCEGFDQYYYTVDSCYLEIADFKAENGGIIIYPNPVEDNLSFYSNNPFVVQQIKSILVFDLKGDLAFQIKDFNKDFNQIGVEGLSTGMYRLVLMDEFSKVLGTIKFIKT